MTGGGEDGEEKNGALATWEEEREMRKKACQTQREQRVSCEVTWTSFLPKVTQPVSGDHECLKPQNCFTAKLQIWSNLLRHIKHFVGEKCFHSSNNPS